MKFTTLGGLCAALAACASMTAAPAFAEEGLWTFDNFPSAAVRQTYGVNIDQPWLDRLRSASVRLTNGCSASVVSPEGLVITNHHCVVDCVQALSTAQNDYVQTGFSTAARSEERRCPGIQAEILTGIADVTPQVRAATAGRHGQDFIRARDGAMTEAERASCGADARLRCQTISFYQGGQYRVYRYRKYEDVRLVWTPEVSIAFFGGDPDNFNFPRFNLDVGVVRLYDGDRPARTPDYLHWNASAPRDGEPTFVSGNPGSTERNLTVAQLETQRDLVLPTSQLQRSELRGRLIEFARGSAENRRIATDPLFGIENSYKSSYGRQLALNDPAVLAGRRAAEDELRRRVAANPELVRTIGDPWADIAAAQTPYQNQFLNYRQIEWAAGSASTLFDYARTIVRGAAERGRPSSERLPEFADTRLPLLERTLLEARPVDLPLERIFLEFWLSKSREILTVDSPVSQTLLGRESPEALAERLVSGTRLGDPAFRRQLWQGGMAAVASSNDPLIQYVLRVDPEARRLRRSWEDQVSGPIERAAERIAQARFAVYGDRIYPDATFTLRLSYGQVQGWTYRGVTVPPTTDFAGLYARATGAEPFQLSQRWLDARPRLTPTTVFNFVTTNDIIGGNSGSPVVNARGEIIGLAFDGNIHSLGGDYFFDGNLNRTVVVSTASITEALTTVYNQPGLLRELRGGGS